MPTYEYVCRACGAQWETFQSIKDSPLKKCASCGAESAERQVSGGGGFILKGGGWYADLYASTKSNGSSSTASSGSSDKSSSGSSDKSSSGSTTTTSSSDKSSGASNSTT